MKLEKKWVTFLVALLAVVAAFLAGNYFYLRPKILYHFPPIPRKKEYRPTDQQRASNRNRASDDVIMNFAESGAGAGVAAGNPFLGRLPEKKVEVRRKQVVVPRLGAIITGDGGAVAVFDEGIYQPGDRIREHTIEAIGDHSVVLAGDYGKLKIIVQPASFGPPRVEILEKKGRDEIVVPVYEEKRER